MSDRKVQCIPATSRVKVWPAAYHLSNVYCYYRRLGVIIPLQARCRQNIYFSCFLNLRSGVPRGVPKFFRGGKVPSPSSASETYSLRTKQEDVFYKINIFLSAGLYRVAYKFKLFVPCVIIAHDATSGKCALFILIWGWHRRHSR